MDGLRNPRKYADRGPHRGVVLLITLVILVILATMGYTLSTRVAARRHRDRYVIDYAKAQYACVSGMKYALASLDEFAPELISRPNEPDFSDVFALTEPQYQQLLTEWMTSLGIDAGLQASDAEGSDVPLTGEVLSAGFPGPYGVTWPLVEPPTELEIGSVKVTIEIEDENAKYPLGWALMAAELANRPARSPLLRADDEEEDFSAEASLGFRTFCEWMGYGPEEFEGLSDELGKIQALRPFKMEYKPLTTAVVPTSLTNRAARTRVTTATATRAATRRTVISPAAQMERQDTGLVRLFHSSLIDADLLTRPTVLSDSRQESAMKYIALWPTRQVNVNSAPRHVLEAALSFGSVADAPRIAEAIIQQRKIKPFSDIEELKRDLLRYSDSLERCRPFITTASTVFSVRVTAISGVARKVAVTGVVTDGSAVKQIAMISD